jgi:hypothetical protein
VEYHREQVESVGRLVVVEAVVPGAAGQAVGIDTDVAVEERDDVVVEWRLEETGVEGAGGQVLALDVVGQSGVVPGFGQCAFGKLARPDRPGRAGTPRSTSRRAERKACTTTSVG